MAVSPNDTFTSGQILTAQECNQYPFGIVAYSAGGTNTSFSTTITDIAGQSVTWTAIAGRGYLLQVTCPAQKTVTDGVVALLLTDGSNNQVQDIDIYLPQAYFGEATFSYLFTGLSAGSKTYKIRAVTSVGNAIVYSTSRVTVLDVGLV